MTNDFTALLHASQNGNREAIDELFPLVYEELRRLAKSKMKSERGEHTLQATALVHEVYVRLIGQNKQTWQSRAHFFGLAAEMMRRILVNYALQRNTEKRFGGQTRLVLDEIVDFTTGQNLNLILLDESLKKLGEFDERQSKIVELKFFGGLTTEEIAEVLEISDSTVKREWRIAKAWLHNELKAE